MKNFIFCSLFFLIGTQVFAQFPGGGFNRGPSIKGKIEGNLIDTTNNEAVAYATVAIKKHKSSLALDGVVTDESGSFKFENVANGKYDLVFSFIGYNEKTITVETTLKDPDLHLGKMFLMPASYELDAVEVQGERALIENKVDKIVFNAENDASIAGGDATDVLRKVPMLSVDLNGNVSLRGSTNVRILINGKPSGMFATNVADALKMFPANQIKKVEVITAPSAKYDGEGSSGIINIITTGKNMEGVAGNINTSIGNRQNNAVLGLNIGKGRFGFNSSGAVFYSTPASGDFNFSREDNGVLTYEQNGSTRTSRLGAQGTLGAFYDFNGFNSINTSFNFRGFGFDQNGSVLGLVNFGGFVDQFTRATKGNNLFGGFDWSTDYTKKFEGVEGKEWSIAFQLNKDNTDSETNVVENHNLFDTLSRISNIFNDGDNYEYTIQTDFVQPFKKGAKLELGAKTVFRDIISDFYNESLQNGVYVKNPLATNIFDYNQDVYAGYASFSFILAKKHNFIVGGRYEHTAIKGQNRFGETNPFANDYGNFLPSVTYSLNLPKFRSIKLSYTQRIQRPSLQYINPFNNNADQLNLQTGNPDLLPELVHQVETAFNGTFGGFTTFSSIYYKYTDDIIESILTRDANGVALTSYSNVGTNQSVGLNTFISKSIKKITLRGGGNIYTYNSKGVINEQSLERNSFMYQLFVSGEYTITGSLKTDFFGMFRSPQRTLQGDNPSFSIYGLGLRKEWKSMSFGLRVIQPHTPDLKFASNIKGNGFTQKSEFSIPFRSLGVSYSYKFGKVDFRERQSKIKNSDLKAGDGGNQGGASGGGTSGQGGSNRN